MLILVSDLMRALDGAKDGRLAGDCTGIVCGMARAASSRDASAVIRAQS